MRSANPRDYYHPQDKKALESLKQIPGFSAALKAFMKVFNENMIHGLNMSNKIRITDQQLPNLYRLLPPVCEKLGIKEPEFYLEMDPVANAYTYGDSIIAITVTSGLVDLMNEEEIQVKKAPLELASAAARRRDTFRIQEVLNLPANKPNVDRLLWREMDLRGVNIRPMDGSLFISGELMIFLLYSGEGENVPVQWLEESIPFSGEIPLSQALEEQVPMVHVRLAHRELEAKPDYDGEMREFGADVVLELDICLYQEEETDILEDVYSTKEELKPVYESAEFQQILAKNVCKCRVAEKVSLAERRPVLQILRSSGSVKLDEVTVEEDSLLLEGVLQVSLLYLTSDDGAPIQAEEAAIPFQCHAAAAGVDENSVYQVIPGLEQLTAVMMGGNSVEVKGVVSLDVLVQEPLSRQVMTGLESQPLDLLKLQKLPGIVGYIVQPEDDLWSIAKKFHTTIDTVRRANELSDGPVKPGQKLILVKEIG